ncbi:MAG: glycosyltransferase family 2 protein [Candidatus Eremiobacteraeota bacterium]|nr:glycosyltransferase family 2 protein [Candidatus Eremiobacteraeota bacterium]
MERLTSVIVPAFNEANDFEFRLARLSAHLDERFGERYELIVVDDGSTDETSDVLRRMHASYPRLLVEEHRENLGMNAAIRSGIAMSRGDRLVILDADLTYAPEITSSLVERIDAGADIALASPYMTGGKTVAVPFSRRVFSVCANKFLSLAVRGRIATLTSMVRAYDAPFARRMMGNGAFTESTFGVLLEAYRENATIVEIPATLDWSAQPRERARRMHWRRIITHSWNVIRAGIRTRPLLLAALPGLIPGLLPFVTLVALGAHASAPRLAQIVVATIAIQYASLGLLSFQLGDFIRRLYAHRSSTAASASERSGRVRA